MMELGLGMSLIAYYFGYDSLVGLGPVDWVGLAALGITIWIATVPNTGIWHVAPIVCVGQAAIGLLAWALALIDLLGLFHTWLLHGYASTFPHIYQSIVARSGMGPLLERSNSFSIAAAIAFIGIGVALYAFAEGGLDQLSRSGEAATAQTWLRANELRPLWVGTILSYLVGTTLTIVYLSFASRSDAGSALFDKTLAVWVLLTLPADVLIVSLVAAAKVIRASTLGRAAIEPKTHGIRWSKEVWWKEGDRWLWWTGDAADPVNRIEGLLRQAVDDPESWRQFNREFLETTLYLPLRPIEGARNEPGWVSLLTDRTGSLPVFTAPERMRSCGLGLAGYLAVGAQELLADRPEYWTVLVNPGVWFGFDIGSPSDAAGVFGGMPGVGSDGVPVRTEMRVGWPENMPEQHVRTLQSALDACGRVQAAHFAFVDAGEGAFLVVGLSLLAGARFDAVADAVRRSLEPEPVEVIDLDFEPVGGWLRRHTAPFFEISKRLLTAEGRPRD